MGKFERPDSHALWTGVVVLGALAFLVVVDRGMPGPR